MDTNHTAPVAGPQDKGAGSDAPDDVLESVQPALPLDYDANDPIPFALTARAKRTVAPEDLPPLSLVPGRLPTPAPSAPEGSAADREVPNADPVGTKAPDGAAARRLEASRAAHPAGARELADSASGALEEPADTRPARARAWRRAGMGTAAIATQLGVDEFMVLAWVGERSRERRADSPTATATSTPTRHGVQERSAPAYGAMGLRTGGAVVGSSALARAVTASGQPALASVPERPEVIDPAGIPQDDRQASHRTELAQRREAARRDALLRLQNDPEFAAGAGIVAGVADVDDHAVTAVTARPRVASTLVDWLVAQVPVDRSQVRVILRIGPRVAGDMARHRWAEALGIPTEQVSYTRWRGAPTADEQEALVRVRGASVAATVGGWCDAVLDPDDSDEEEF